MTRIICAAAFFAAAAFAQCISPVTTVLPDSATNTYTSGTVGFGATSTITAAGNGTSLTISGSAGVTFTAGSSITLQPGFHATALNGGATFKAQIAPVSQYQVTATPSPSAGGSVSLTPCSQTGYFGNGTTVTFQANAANGYGFTGWTGALSGTANPQTIAVTGPVDVTANFASATPLQIFTSCVSASGTGSTCTLPAGTYDITQTIVIGRSNITVQGGGSTRSQTLLVRDPAFPATNSADCVSNPANSDCGNQAPLMEVNASTPLSGITIQNLTFCGDSNIDPYSGSPCPAPSSSDNSSDRTKYETIPTNPTPYPFQLCVDLYVQNADTGNDPADPFTYTGPYSVQITNADFESAAGHAIALYPTTWVPQVVNDIFINNTAVNNSGVTGILIGANTAYENQSLYGRLCDSIPNYNNDISLGLPRDIRIETNTFQNNLTGVIAIGSARWIAIQNNNTFTNNYIDPQVNGNQEGGNVFVDQCADTVHVYHNMMTGPTNPAYGYTSGLEFWGRNIDAEYNSITGYPLEGIGPNSVYNLTIANNTLTGDNTNPQSAGGGIGMFTAGFGACSPVPRDMQNVTISGNNLTGNIYGVHIQDYASASRDVIDYLTIGSNTFPSTPIFQDYMVVLNGFSSQDPPALGLPPSSSKNSNDTGPIRVLPVLNSLQYPLCPTGSQTDSDEDTFTFEAADEHGASSITDFEIIFSQFGSDSNGSGGPGNPNNPPQGGDCHFAYYQGSNTVYLDNQNGEYDWVASSVVGPGGTNLTNGYCTIHAGSSNSQVSTGQKNLYLSLDISFPSGTTHQHIYEFAYDQTNDLYSYSNNWYYWGWWLAP